MDDSGQNFWSKFDEGEWQILQSYIKESSKSTEEVIKEIMEDRLKEGKVTFGYPFSAMDQEEEE